MDHSLINIIIEIHHIVCVTHHISGEKRVIIAARIGRFALSGMETL